MSQEPLFLTELHEGLKDAYRAFLQDFLSTGEKLVPFVLKLDSSNFPEFIRTLRGYSRGIGVPEGFANHTTFFLMNGELIRRYWIDIGGREGD